MSTAQGALVVLCGWEGNRGFGVALAVRHRLWYGLTGLRPVSPYQWSQKGRGEQTPTPM